MGYVDSRQHYMFFADNYYISARYLILGKFSLIGGVIAAMAVEQYLKLKAYEFRVPEQSIMSKGHSLRALFKKVKIGMDLNTLPLKSFKYYRRLLMELEKYYRCRFYDKKGAMREICSKGCLTLGFGDDKRLEKFGEICCQLRNAVFLAEHPGLVGDLIFKKEVRREGSPQISALYKNNKQIINFEMYDLQEKHEKLVHKYRGIS